MSGTLERTIVQPWLPPYEKITENVYINRRCANKFSLEEADVCQCRVENNVGCSDACLNRSLFTECVAGTCPCGDVCQNQRLQKRKWATVSLSHFGVKGWGVVATEPLICGQLVVEYIGEICDLTEVERRSRRYERLGLKNTYIMNLNPNAVIDATAMGNYSRFINHACSPNAECQKWTVKGEQRIAIFATQDITVGEEITYNYNLDWNGGRRVKCQCGAYNCSGFLGAESVLWRKTVQNTPQKQIALNPCFVASNRVVHDGLSSGESCPDVSTPERQSQSTVLSPTTVMTRSKTSVLHKTDTDVCGSGEFVAPSKKRRLESSRVTPSTPDRSPKKPEVDAEPQTPEEKHYPLLVMRPLPRKYSDEDPPLQSVNLHQDIIHPLLLSVVDAVPLTDLLCDPFLILNQDYYMTVADITLVGLTAKNE